MDYSENINLTAKHEAQSAHFSGRQYTLHCTVLEEGDSVSYLYHLSNDTRHDSVMRFTILEDILKEYPHVIEMVYL